MAGATAEYSEAELEQIALEPDVSEIFNPRIAR
jgi:hypothetical protein